jgi:hypothetical protein
MSASGEVLSTELPSNGISTAAEARHSRLAGRIAAVRTRAAGGSLDRWLLVIGGILMPLGFLLIVLGWIGTSHTVLLFEQIPYMVSGGLLGLGFVFAGGFVYFAYWQTVLVRDTRAERRELVDALQRIETLLASGAAGGTRVNTANGRYVATAGGSMFHRPDCPVVVDRDNLRDVSAADPALIACSICDPTAVAETTQ